jgi:hypothetical protein
MITSIYVSDIISQVVTSATAGKYSDNGDSLLLHIQNNESYAKGAQNIHTIGFEYAKGTEVLETLWQKDNDVSTQDRRFPLVYLHRPFTEKRGTDPGIYAEVSLKISILHHTEQAYKQSERDEKVFHAVLYPIYYQFLRYLARHPRVVVQDENLIPHDKTDLPAVQASDGKTMLNEYADAILIENLRFKIRLKTGC